MRGYVLIGLLLVVCGSAVQERELNRCSACAVTIDRMYQNVMKLFPKTPRSEVDLLDRVLGPEQVELCDLLCV